MNELTYNEAINELEKILEELENNTEINFDQITQKVQRATELLEFCNKKLHQIDEDMEKLLSKLDESITQ
ncbi:MAG TPA: exodeoxyribonuclease VII small subunit [Paludibacteraceae bacterium]|nr:exodeoxyribonuclease VII small subunit [Paludibacteraceae bacterium]HOL00857.1 exodeoxyribonuclease VII small subunit [Paludibacteraceae bacterium]HPO67719.1 exodeoxyribonuclease VII small subunit [Paludibacteraceae bacterium]